MNKITLGFFRTKSTATIKTVFVLFAVLLMNTQTSWGQISITGIGSGNTYTQDFSVLANTSAATSSIVPSGWAFLETGTGADALYLVNSGASSTGNTFSYGAIGNADRAFGGLQSGSLIPTIGASFTNNSGETITQLVIAYTGEQWRLGALGRVDRLDFQYSLNATSLNTGTWTDVNSLDFTAPVTTGTASTAIDGNAIGNKTSISGTISGLSIAPGATFWLRFNDFNATGADDGLAVDDFSIYGTVPVITNYYYDGSGSLATLSNWGTSTNGSGTNPLDFGSATSDQVFVITNTAAVATDATWTIGGNNKVVVGDATKPAVALTISVGSPITLGTSAIFDIAAASSGNNEVIFQDASFPTLGAVDVSANITYANGGTAIAVTNIPCNTLKISNTTAVTLNNNPFCKFLVVDAGSSITAVSTSFVITLSSGGSATINGAFTAPRAAGLYTTGIVASNDRGNIHSDDVAATIALGVNSKIIFSRNASGQSIAPLSYADLEIRGQAPGVVLSTDITVSKDLTLPSLAVVTVNPGNDLTVAGAIVNDGTLTIENNANLIQTALTNTNSGAGSTIVKRNSNPLFRLDYTMWSSPVTGQNLLNFSPATLATRFYTYDNTLPGGTGTGLYTAVASPSTTPFATGTGYLIRMPDADPATDYNAGTGTLTYPGQFTGIPNNGTVTLSGLTSDEFYAVGNPYPSSIGANAFINGNSTDGTLYFWRKKNAGSGTAYATYNLVGTTVTSAQSGNGSAFPNGTIAVGQGFIVKTGVAATTLEFTNAMRTSSNTASFFKTKNTADKSRLWLNLTNASGVFSQALIGYVDGATNGFDNGIDGKYINDSPIALTSNINGVDYTIQGRPAFDASDVVALNFKTDIAGDYTIAIDHVDGLFSGSQDIYLVDSKTGTETNLKTSSYTFTAAAAVDNTRFSLKFQKTLSLDAQELNDNSVIVYKNGGVIYVNSGAKTINNIKVFDILGRVVAERNNVKANTTSIQNLRASNQVLIVKVTTDDNQVISKKVEN